MGVRLYIFIFFWVSNDSRRQYISKSDDNYSYIIDKDKYNISRIHMEWNATINLTIFNLTDDDNGLYMVECWDGEPVQVSVIRLPSKYSYYLNN